MKIVIIIKKMSSRANPPAGGDDPIFSKDLYISS